MQPVFVDNNLADAMLACLRVPQSAGDVYLVSDGEALSLSELVARLAGTFLLHVGMTSAPLPGGGLSGHSGLVSRRGG